MTGQKDPSWEHFYTHWHSHFEPYLAKLFQDQRESWLSSRILDPIDFSQINQKIDLFSAMDYACTGGKRIRPLLMALSYHSVSEKAPEDDPLLFEFASALEMIHSYSLVHDDLPGMDNDEFRRGKRTVHAKYGQGTGILTGDALLNFAFERASLAVFQAPGDRKDAALESLLCLSQMSGVSGMIGGQALDLNPALLGQARILSLMVEKKTCCLFMAACRVGGLLGGGSKERIEALTDFAFFLGQAYQMKDDNQDRKKDLQSGKVTYAGFYPQQDLQKEVENFTDQAIQALKGIPRKEELESLAIKLVTRKK